MPLPNDDDTVVDNGNFNVFVGDIANAIITLLCPQAVEEKCIRQD